jgi:LPXTG-motif cell wall-anchored protein
LHRICIAAVALAALLTCLLASAPVRGQAVVEPATVDIALHKLLFAPGTMPDAAANDGQTNPFAGGEPLNGVTFTAYDVTTDFWTQNPQTKDQMAAAQEQIAAPDYVAASPVATVTTTGQGVAMFARLPLRSHGHYAVYLFRETRVPRGVRVAQNLVVALPLGTSRRIDLYPKNEGAKPVTTGGQRFVKVDARNGRKLAGAQFVIRNQAGEYLTRQQQHNQWKVVSGGITSRYQQEKLVTLTSNVDGSFSVDGLTGGKYALVEVRAPAGYVRSRHPVTFTVVPGKFSSAVPAMNVVNVRQPETPPDTGVPPLPGTGIFTRLRRFLPQTGAARATWLTILGIGLLVIIIGIWHRKRSETHNDEGE